MNYLTRPVFLFTPNWSDAISRRIQFDLRAEDLGFGGEYFSPTQTWPVNNWRFGVELSTGAELGAFNDFFSALVGRLNGFWLPTPLAAGIITAGASTSVFSIANEGLAGFWNDRPDGHLFFTFADGSQAAAKIQSVVDAGATETVTLTTALPHMPNAGTVISRLHYVRLTDDVEKGTFVKENHQVRAVDVIELPTEYAEAETGLRPIFLYHLWSDAPVNLHWYFTSFAANIVSNGKIHLAWQMTHGEIKEGTDGQDNSLDIEARPDAVHPFSLFNPIPLGKPLRIQIGLASYAAPDTVKPVFTGRITSVSDTGTVYKATAETVLGRLKNKVPRCMIGPTCPYVLYDPQTCRAPRAPFETTLDFVSQTDAQPPVLKCTFALLINQERNQAEDFFRYGLVETGFGTGYEIRSVLASHWNAGTGQLELTLNFPFKRIAAGQQVQAVAGCDHAFETCDAKFNNADNHASFTQIPDTNLSINALNAVNSAGGKK